MTTATARKSTAHAQSAHQKEPETKQKKKGLCGFFNRVARASMPAIKKVGPVLVAAGPEALPASAVVLGTIFTIAAGGVLLENLSARQQAGAGSQRAGRRSRAANP